MVFEVPKKVFTCKISYLLPDEEEFGEIEAAVISQEEI